MSEQKAPIAVILAGGEGRRMGGADKGALLLNGRRLIDLVIEKLQPQVQRILISAPHDYETNLTHLPDRDDGPAGPAAGLWSALCWRDENAADAKGFLTAPVDGPFLPPDLFDRLCAAGKSAIARDDAGVHPTFAYWRAGDLRAAFKGAAPGEGLSLKGLAKKAGAREITFPGDRYFRNINTPEELADAETFDPRAGDL